MRTLLLASLSAFTLLPSAFAQENPANPEGARINLQLNATPLTPLLDTPLRDTQVLPAPDGSYYLTGTHLTDPARIHLWRSTDLKTWTPLGPVWDIAKQSTWHKQPETPYGQPFTAKTRDVRAPELHFVNNSFYLIYSMAYGGIGLLKSTTAKPEGPYAEHANLLPYGLDPSLTTTPDGATFLVFDGGKIARLAPDLKTLAEPVRQIIPANLPAKGWGAMPVTDRVGTYGAQIFKHDGKYHLLASDPTSRLGITTQDAYLAASTGDIYGPYNRRYLAITHAAQSSVFTSHDGQLLATFSGSPTDSFAITTDRFSLVNLTPSPLGRLRPNGEHILEKGPIGRLHPVQSLKDEWIRDPSITLGHDNAYYLVGTKGWGWAVPQGGIEIWRSTDLTNWTPLGLVWTFEKDATWQKNPPPIPAGSKRQNKLWAPEIRYFNDNYWITPCFNWGVTGLLKSATGKPEGPYIDPVGKPLVDGIDGFFFPNDDGKIYFQWGPGHIAELKPDGSGLATQPITLKTTAGEPMGYEGGCILKHRGKYIFFSSEWYGDHEGTYDLMYSIGDTPLGPYGPRRYGVPHAGHATVFRGADNKIYCTVFGSDGTAPYHMRLGLVEITFDDEWNLQIVDRKIGH